MRTTINWSLTQTRLSTSVSTFVVLILSTSCSKQSSSKSPVAPLPTVQSEEDDADAGVPEKKPKKASKDQIEESSELESVQKTAEPSPKKPENTPIATKTTTTPKPTSTGTGTGQTPPAGPDTIDPEVAVFACNSKMTAPQILAWAAKDNPAPGMTAAQFASIKKSLEGTTETQLAAFLAEKCPPM